MGSGCVSAAPPRACAVTDVHRKARARGAAFQAHVPTARAVTLPGPHFLFIADPTRVAEEIERALRPAPEAGP